MQLVCDLLKTGLRINVSSADISTVHRVGKKSINQQVDERNIIMKLCRRDLKGDVLRACRQLKPDFYIKV